MKILLIITLLIINSICLFSQKTFKIVFVADPLNINSSWLQKIATDWGATGICLRAIWGDIDYNNQPGVYYWDTLDSAIATILNNKFNITKILIFILE